MAQHLPYPVTYIAQQTTHPSYYTGIQPSPQHHHHHHAHIAGQVHLVAPQARTEQPIRKRPKYTRSKTGCLTCRGKKIKCDETKPKCTRCANGQRECTWPELPPPKKKAAARKSSATTDERPSNSDSASRVSESSSTSRDATPLLAANTYASATVDRRYSEPQSHNYLLSGVTNARRQTIPNVAQGSPSLPLSSPGVHAPLPELQSPYQHSISSSYAMSHSSSSAVSSRSNSRPSTANSLPPSRFPGHGMDTGHYSTGMANVEPKESYYTSNQYTSHQSVSDRDMMSRHLSHEHHSRI